MEIPRAPYLRIRVQPRSSKNEITEIMQDGTIKIRITAVPEKNQANQMLIKFLSKHLSIPKSEISIISGKTDRLKLVKIAPWT